VECDAARSVTGEFRCDGSDCVVGNGDQEPAGMPGKIRKRYRESAAAQQCRSRLRSLRRTACDCGDGLACGVEQQRKRGSHAPGARNSNRGAPRLSSIFHVPV
jgi:hypothetical protein